MKNIIKTCFGAAFVIIGITTFVVDFMTVGNGVDMVRQDPYPLQWVSVVGAILCAGGVVLVTRAPEMLNMSDARNTNLNIKNSCDVNINWGGVKYVNDVTIRFSYVTPNSSWLVTFDQQNKNKTNMGNLLYLIAVILILFWLIGFFAYGASGIIHILLIIAIVAILLRVISGSRVIK